jgi:hypothetical protein
LTGLTASRFCDPISGRSSSRIPQIAALQTAFEDLEPPDRYAFVAWAVARHNELSIAAATQRAYVRDVLWLALLLQAAPWIVGFAPLETRSHVAVPAVRVGGPR